MSSRKRHQDSRDDGHSKRKKHDVDLYDCRYDLNSYLKDKFNIDAADDFWKFYGKYDAAQKVKKQSNIQYSRSGLFNIKPIENEQQLFDKLPLYTRRGDKMHISFDKFKYLLDAIVTYQDFQQKTKFAKLKALRNGQNELPIARFKEEILQTIKENRVVLIAGDTGCGKSTQVPQYILEAGYNKIACTQPRRIACVSLAKRVAHETLSAYKNDIGFQIRFEKSKNKETKVIFLTEGILLRQASDADVLSSYEVIILDEVHERHLNMDFLVGIMKCLLHKKEFKLVLMSATINLGLFEEYFAVEGVKTIKVPGRLYPIDIIYKPIVKDVYDKKTSKFDCQPYLNILELIDAKYKPHEKGDVLIFLNGFNEINTLASAVTEYSEIRKNWIVLQLHSSLSLEEQDRVFYMSPDGVRKCIISTNIAETSVTIDGVRFVIDSGKVNRMTYENGGVNRLFETAISQDSAKQRAGRAGRTGPGICYRLYSEEDLKDFETFTPAEIHLVPLENLVLNMVTMGLANVEAFPFLEKPSSESLLASLEKLSFLEALRTDENGLSLTTLGNAMSRLPVDLTIGKMLIVSTIFGTVNAALALASLLSVQSPLVENRYYETQESRRAYESNHGEPITLLNLYKSWLQVKQDGSYARKGENSRTWCRRQGIEEQRFYEVTKLIEQFRDILQDAELIPKMDKETLTSSDRAIRNGELKKLRSLRRELKNDSRDVRRKKLEVRSSEQEEGDVKDLRDVEFRITNDFKKLQRLLKETKTDSYKDLTLLKLILTGALYPQVAVEDEFNSSKTVNERLFHTKAKNYVSLRPNSYFSSDSEIMQLNDSDIDVPPNGYFSKRPLSKKHQILVFQKLLETKKTYIINTFRMPALQTLFLFSKRIATNRILTKFIFDDFLCCDCPFLGEGKVLLFQAIELRKKMKKMLEQKLSEPSVESTEEEKFDLIEELANFMQKNVSYNIKRLLAADVKVVYSSQNDDAPTANPFDPNFRIVPNKIGGFDVTENVVYDCLVPDSYELESENLLLSSPFHCPKCKESFPGLGFLEMLIHENECKKSHEPQPESSKAVASVKPNSKNFHCAKCDKNLLLTPVDFLKHKKYCVPVKLERETS